MEPGTGIEPAVMLPSLDYKSSALPFQDSNLRGIIHRTPNAARYQATVYTPIKIVYLKTNSIYLEANFFSFFKKLLDVFLEENFLIESS